MPSWSRATVALLAAALCPFAFAGCDSLYFPADGEPTALAFSLSAGSPAAAGGAGDAFDAADRAHVRVLRDGGVLLDTIVALSAPGATRTAELRLDLRREQESLELEVVLEFAGQPLFEGSTRVTLQQGQASTAEVTLVPVVADVLIDAIPALSSIGERFQLSGAAVFATGDTVRSVEVSWSSLDPAVLFVTPDGGAEVRTEGEARVMARAGRRTTTSTIVVEAQVASVEVDRGDALSLAVAEEVVLVAVARDANGNVLDRRAEWRSTAPGTASVAANGRVRGLNAGQALVIATLGSRSDTVVVTVVRDAVASIAVEPSRMTLDVGQTLTLRATLRSASGDVLAGRVVTWTSSDARVAMVDARGLVEPRGAGTATVRAASEGVFGEAVITVRVPVVSLPDLHISSGPPGVAPTFIAPGQMVTLAPWTVRNAGPGVAGAFSIGYYLSADANITSGDTFLDADVLPGLGPGVSFGPGAQTLTIPANTAPGTWYVGILVDRTNAIAESSESNNHASVAVTVTGPTARVEVLPNPVTLSVGKSVQLVATARDANGNVLQGRTFVWTSSNASVVSVNAGLVTALAAGQAVVSAAADGVTGSASVSVTTFNPDLVITSGAPTATPSTVAAGGRVTLSAWTVANAGSGAAGGFSNGFYLSTDGTISSSDTYLDGNSVAGLASGASINWSGQTLTIPSSTAPGTYYIGILVDHVNRVVETNEGNNSVSVRISVTAPLAANVVISPDPAAIAVGASLQLTARAYDANGNLLTGKKFDWASSSATVASVLQNGTITGVAAGSATVTATTDGIAGKASVTVTALQPDLIITTGTPTATPSAVAPGARVSLSGWTVKNQGAAPSGSFNNGFYLSTDAVISASDVYLDGNSNSGLAPGASFAWGGPTLTIPAATTPGTYYMGILVDRTNANVESNEGNNWVSVPITVTAAQADLVITSGSPTVTPTTVIAGSTLTLSGWTVKNVGTAASGFFSNGFYLSTNAVISTADVYLTGNSNSGLAPGASFTWGGPTLTIPAGTASGTYYIGILVDRNNSVAESSESNNYVSAQIKVITIVITMNPIGPDTDSVHLEKPRLRAVKRHASRPAAAL